MVSDIDQFGRDTTKNNNPSLNEEKSKKILDSLAEIKNQLEKKDYNPNIDDSSSRIEIILYSELIETNQETIIDNQLYFITGQLSFDDYSGSLNMKASSIMDLEKTRTRYSKGIELLIRESKTNDDTLEKLSSILEPHKNGKCPVIIKCVSNNHVVPLKLNNEWHINPTTDIIDNLGDLLGSENIIVKYH